MVCLIEIEQNKEKKWTRLCSFSIKSQHTRTQLMIEDFSSRNLLCFVLIKIKGKFTRALILIEQKAQ